MYWVTILYIAMAAFSATIAGIYLVAWFLQRDNEVYLIFVVLAFSIAALATTELWMLYAQTPEEYATALRWFQVPIWSGFLALLGLVHLRLRPRHTWVGWLAAGLRTVSLVANFLSGPNLNYAELSAIDHFTLLGEEVAVAADGIPNPWMLVGQASLLLALLFLFDGGISTWRRGEGKRSLVLTVSLLFAVLVGTVQVVLVFWGLVQFPILVAPLFLFVGLVMGSELSFGLLRAALAEREVKLKDVALGLSEQRLSLAAEAADAGFWSLDEKSGSIWATTKTRELFGLAPDGELSLVDFMKRVHPQDRTRLEQMIKAALRSSERYRTEFRVVHRNGEVRWLAGLGRCVARPEPDPSTLMGVIVDITDRVTMLDELARQRTRLERISRLETLTELSGSLAHELNQPLAMILTNAEAAQSLLAKTPPDLSEMKEILADIVTADRRAADVIQHLRGLLDRGEPQYEALMLNDEVREVIALIGNQIDDQGVTMDLDLEQDLPSVQADRILIEQVLLNLLHNACEAVANNPPGERRVSIVTRASSDEVLVEITDNGCGLSDPDRIFEAFYSTKPRGLGIGLVIVRSVVESHGGRVRAASMPNGGTTVHFSLPRGTAAS